MTGPAIRPAVHALIGLAAVAVLLAGTGLARASAIDPAIGPAADSPIAPETAAASAPAVRPAAGAGPGVALVVGNARYAVNPLRKPVQDACAMADLLRGLGYEVIETADADEAALRSAADRFGERLAAVGGLGLAYYSGHAVQVDGANYLLPVDLPPNADTIAVRSHALPLGYLLDRMRSAGPRASVVLLDACRTEPGGASGPVAGAPGLAPASAGPGGIVAYAAQAGATADEGVTTDPNSRFTAALLEVLTTDPGLPLDTLLKRVQQAVMAATGGRQVPEYTYGAGLDPVILAPPKAEAAPLSAPPEGSATAASRIPAPGACSDAVRNSIPSSQLPKDLGAYCYNLRDGVILLGSGDYGKAMAAFERATEAASALNDPDQRAGAADEARLARSLVLEARGDVAAALTLMATPASAKTDWTATARGYQLARHGLYREAALELDKAARVMPDFVCDLDRQAAAAFRRGRPLQDAAPFGRRQEDWHHLPSFLYPGVLGCRSKCKCGGSPPIVGHSVTWSGRDRTRVAAVLRDWMREAGGESSAWVITVHSQGRCASDKAVCDARSLRKSRRQAEALLAALQAGPGGTGTVTAVGVGREQPLPMLKPGDARQSRVVLTLAPTSSVPRPLPSAAPAEQ